ncbi:glycoside hydrolase family 88 protein [Haloferula rosea]|uniref:Glycoside hydrolase family 88 protein n=1 Tax=Haloferula rosea TaxID=490093 RepID=A0A934RDC3_9BACT|nr:glycoside hydrolase family 88 protein [Haloferula rosea]MBK1827623.1 glycoside hydrolase family 88 protein [Haloferula rosea]
MAIQSDIDTLATPCMTDVESALGASISKIRKFFPSLVASPASWGFDRAGHYSDRNESFYHIDNWTTSFFAGMALIASAAADDPELLDVVGGLKENYEEKIGRHGKDTMHDLGFLFSLYSVALYRRTGEERHRETGLRAARLLADRFIEPGDYIRAWGRMDDSSCKYQGLAIVDSLMNLPLLYWAAKEEGDTRLRDIAIRHTNTTLKHFVRPDGSVFHAFRFDPETGSPLGGDNYCGLDIDSHWARGASWAMYGFALGFRHTGDASYLAAARKVAEKFVNELDGVGVPVWDFSLAHEDTAIRDSSAAAIACCAIQELDRLGEATPALLEGKERMIRALCSERFLDSTTARAGLLREGEVGDGQGSFISVYTSWGDYFFTQAVAEECGYAVDFWH